MGRPFMTWQHKDILLDEADKEIEQLKKENEWLIDKLLPIFIRDIPGLSKPEISKESGRVYIKESMQQALKEK